MIISIVDLDNTLVNTEVLKKYRNQKMWEFVYDNIHKTSIDYFTIKLLDELKNTDFIIVTSSPFKYAKMVLEFHNINYKKLITFYDTLKRKPFPDPYIKAISTYDTSKIDEIRIYGDEENDFIAADNFKKYLLNIGKNLKILKIGCAHYKDNNLKNVDETRR